MTTRILAFSDVHTDLSAIQALARRASNVDILVGAGDFGRQRTGLQPVIDAIGAIKRPTVLVCGNAETPDELRAAASPYAHITVLHGNAARINGVTFFGLGAAVPVTPFGSWSVDLTEEEATTLLAGCPEKPVLVVHSPPQGHCDITGAGEHMGSRAILECVQRCQPSFVFCGHIHDSWETTSQIGSSQIMNVGPRGVEVPVT